VLITNEKMSGANEMTAHDDIRIALLRGINVGGHGRLPMAKLRDILVACGARDPQTYIQSGNAVFRGAVEAEELAQAIERAKGFRPRAMVLTRQELSATIAGNPFSEATAAPKTLHVYFLSGP
jgi:uncharacterized protein (DUF1697 family)